jgi:hypothetical protein
VWVLCAKRRGQGAVAIVLATLGCLPLLAASQPKITAAQRIAIIRLLVAKVGIARAPLPPDKHGIVLSPQGRILNAGSVENSLQNSGNSAKIGDRVAITAITFKGNRIVFAINGGPHKSHWYSHISLGMGGSAQPIVTKAPSGPHGALISLQFAHAVPPISPQQVQAALASLIDWGRPSRAEVLVRSLPPSVRAAIKAHKPLVGMTAGMVVAALGRTGDKIRERDKQGQTYEDWIYGKPPARTTFVRFIGERVTRVTTYLPGGGQIVDNTPDPALAATLRQIQRNDAERAAEAAEPPPTLRRPGDAPPPKRGDPGQAPVMVPPMQDNGVPSTAPGQGMPSGMPSGMPPAQGPPGQGPPPTCCGLAVTGPA